MDNEINKEFLMELYYSNDLETSIFGSILFFEYLKTEVQNLSDKYNGIECNSKNVMSINGLDVELGIMYRDSSSGYRATVLSVIYKDINKCQYFDVPSILDWLSLEDLIIKYQECAKRRRIQRAIE